MKVAPWSSFVVVLVGVVSCRGRLETRAAPQDDAGEAPECIAYAADYEHCLRGLTPDREIPTSSAAITRESLRVAAVDPSARDRVNERCRIARTQLKATCQ